MLVRFAQSKHIFSWVILVSLVFGMLAPVASGLTLASSGTSPTDNSQNAGSSTPNAARSESTTSKEAATKDASAGILDCVTNPMTCAGVGITTALKMVFAWLGGYAAALFVWVVNPGNMSGPTGIMNAPAVYEMWKFVRDFFNLFFILILLLSAFATVFQVENFSIRKIFLNVLFAALIINFSFPITRFLIDLTNVPMYYFLNAILPGQPGGKGFVSIWLASTGFGGLPMGATGAFAQSFMQMVFTFLLAVSLLVLGVMFTIRLIALTLLLIFSPFGFAAALMPGFQKLGQEWWGKFWSYAFFGPAAALVLLVAIRFMESVSVGGVYFNLKQTTTDMTAGSPEANSMANMLFYLIPLILIWTAIGMANRFSIAGAGKVVGWGESFSRWTAKKAGRGAKWVGMNNPVAKTAKGLGSGLKDRALDTKFAKWMKSPSSFESGAKGFAKGKGWNAGVATEKEKYYNKQINEKIAKNKEERISRSEALKQLDSKDDTVRVAAAASLSQMDNGIQTMEDLNKVLKALADPSTGRVRDAYKDRAADIIAKTDKKIIASTAATPTDPAKSGIQNLSRVIETLGANNQKAIADLIDKLDESAFEGTGDHMESLYTTMNGVAPTLNNSLKSKMFKEGGARVLVEHLATRVDPATGRRMMSDDAAVQTVLRDIKSVKDIIASGSLFQDATYGNHARAFVRSLDPLRQQEIKKAAAQESANPGLYS